MRFRRASSVPGATCRVSAIRIASTPGCTDCFVNACLDLVRRRRGARSRSSSAPIDSTNSRPLDRVRRPRTPGRGAEAPRSGPSGSRRTALPPRDAAQEVAVSLGIPHGTARSRLHYALTAMRTRRADRGRHRPRPRSREGSRHDLRTTLRTGTAGSPGRPLHGPDAHYRDRVLQQTARTRQRPAWSFLERWLPMVDVARQPVLAQRLPWRTIGLGLVLIGLLVAMIAALVVGLASAAARTVRARPERARGVRKRRRPLHRRPGDG